jgi:hypothetical protein
MTASEVLTKLINIGIVHKIGEDYFLTSKINEAMDYMDLPEESVVNLPKTIVIGELYPPEIREAPPGKKAEAILLYCKVPILSDSNYLLHSIDGISRNQLNLILKNKEYKPDLLLKAISDYYKHTSYPKGFGKFIREGDLITLYKWYLAGNKLSGTDVPDNTKWQ